jgi:hypothetical protein
VTTEDKDNYGKTALDYAKERVESEGNSKVAQSDFEEIKKELVFNRRKGILWVLNSTEKISFKRKRRPKQSKQKIYV